MSDLGKWYKTSEPFFTISLLYISAFSESVFADLIPLFHLVSRIHSIQVTTVMRRMASTGWLVMTCN